MAFELPPLRSLRGRILALVLGLVALVLAAAIAAVAVTARAQVERQTGTMLRTASDTARELLSLRGAELAGAAGALVSDADFRQALSAADAAALQSAVDGARKRVGADLVVVLSPEGRTLASTFGGSVVVTERDLAGLTRGVAQAEAPQLYRLIDGRPYQVAIARIGASEPQGWAVIGFALDDRVAEDLSRLLGVDVSFVAAPERHPAFVASSADRDDHRPDAGIAQAPRARPVLVGAGGEQLVTWTDEIRCANGSLTLVLQRSLSSALRPYEEMRNSMLAIGALLLACAAAVAVLLTRSATRSVEDLTRAAARLEAGEYDIEIPRGGPAELEGLAGAFDGMRAAVAAREASIRHQADHHPLTGLATRARISAILHEVLAGARQAGRAVTVCLVEVQQLHSVVGSFGHAAGDQVLREVARRLAGNGGRSDRMAHVGTDQFLAIHESGEVADPARRAAALVERLRGPFDYAGVSFQLEMRAGAAAFPADGATAEELLQRADLALLRAKETGAAVGVYLKGDDGHHRHRLSILGKLRRAIEADELELHYQPKVVAATGRPMGCEALVRWRHPEHGFIPPADFIPHAERTGAIRSLTAWVLATACRDASRWEQQGIAVDVSINVSPVDFADPGFADHVALLLVQTGVDASRIVLEVTESGAMRDLAVTLRMMEQLRVLGIRFSIDDFGTGYSSLAHLKRLPVDEVKIDRSFIKELEERSDDDAVLRSTIGLAHALDLKVVAEGVEQASSWAALGRLGCDLIQGYYVSKPMPAAEFAAWMHARGAPRTGAPGTARADRTAAAGAAPAPVALRG